MTQENEHLICLLMIQVEWYLQVLKSYDMFGGWKAWDVFSNEFICKQILWHKKVSIDLLVSQNLNWTAKYFPAGPKTQPSLKLAWMIAEPTVNLFSNSISSGARWFLYNGQGMRRRFSNHISNHTFRFQKSCNLLIRMQFYIKFVVSRYILTAVWIETILSCFTDLHKAFCRTKYFALFRSPNPGYIGY